MELRPSELLPRLEVSRSALLPLNLSLPRLQLRLPLSTLVRRLLEVPRSRSELRQMVKLLLRLEHLHRVRQEEDSHSELRQDRVRLHQLAEDCSTWVAVEKMLPRNQVDLFDL